MQTKKLTRKTERKQNLAAFKSLTDYHTAQKQLQEVLFAGYRLAVAAYFGSDLPKALVDRMNVKVAEVLTHGAENQQDVELAAPIQQVVADYRAAEREKDGEFAGMPDHEPTLEELADAGGVK